jgi:hypothetical protein
VVGFICCTCALKIFLHLTVSSTFLYLHVQVGAYAVYIWRHQELFRNGKEVLESVKFVVLLNLVLILISVFVFCRLLVASNAFARLMCSV